MNREEFIQKFNKHFHSREESRMYHFSIEAREFANELEFKENYYQKFLPFFEKLKIKNKYDILDKVENNKQYDAYYEDENPDSDFCSFTCKININNLYDIIKKLENYSHDKTEVYRIENPDNKGLYDTFFASLPVDEIHHPNPRSDENFLGVFDKNTDDYYYTRKWSFGFSSLEEVKDWLMTTENEVAVANKGCYIKNFTIDSDYVLSGYKQLIFQKEEKVSEEIIHWNKLKEVSKSRSIPEMKIGDVSEELKNAFKTMKKYDLEVFVYDACESGDIETVKYVLENKNLGIKVNTFDGSFLHKAAQKGHLDIVRYLLTNPKFKNQLDIHSSNGLALRNAAENGHLEVVKYLLTSEELKTHAKINAEYGLAFKNACVKGHLEIVKYLLTSPELKEHADIVEDGGVGFIEACSNNRIEVARYLLTSPELKQNVDIHDQNDAAFEYAVKSGELSTIHFLMFEMNIEKTKHIQEFLKKNPNEEIERWFKLRDLNNKLEEKLEKKDIKEKGLKSKI